MRAMLSRQIFFKQTLKLEFKAGFLTFIIKYLLLVMICHTSYVVLVGINVLV